MTEQERYRQRLGDFGQALKRLEEGLREAHTELTRDGVIQRFEFTYEQAWKTVKLWLAEKDIIARNAKDALSAALEQGLIEDGNLWSRIHESRNLMSHTYNEKDAGRVFAFVRDEGFAAIKELHEKMTATK